MRTRRTASKPSPIKSVTWRDHVARGLDYGMEGLVYLIVLSTPWVVGGYLPVHVFASSCALGLMLVLWSIKQMIHWRLTLHRCAVSIGLVALFVSAAVMLLAVPRPVQEWISPEAARLHTQLLPENREQPVAGPAATEPSFSPGATLSLYPGATQTRLLDVLSALVLFVIVRHALATPERFRRLAYVLVLNGCALAIFGLWQKVRSPGSVVYVWTIEGAQTFGPFINRNHFAMYVNCCVCLGLGLFLANLTRARHEYATGSRGMGSTQYLTNSLTDILQHPAAVWVLVPVAVGVTGVLASLSRGGIAALVIAAGAACFVLRRRGWNVLVPLIVIPIIALGLLIWYGAEPTLERIDQEHVATEGRFTIWQACWEAAKRFPLVGTGLGTFQYVEPMYRPSGADQDSIITHAHNEYLEALVEGGIIRLLLTLLLVVLVLRYGWRAARALPIPRDQLLALGGWAACITVTVHSIGEFGVHLPAIASVLAVIAAYLTAFGSNAGGREDDGTLIRFHYFGIGPVLGALVAIMVGLALVSGAWRELQSDLFRNAALATSSEAKGDPELLRAAVAQYDAALAFTPAHFRLRMERYAMENRRLEALRAAHLLHLARADAGHLASRFALLLGRGVGGPLYGGSDLVLTPLAEQVALGRWFYSEQVRSWPAQARHLLAARDACPIAWQPHLEIAQHVLPRKAVLPAEDRFHYWVAADPHEAYLDRVKQLRPYSAETWFLCGQQEGLNGRRADAVRSWRRSLELSDQFLEPIVRQSARQSELSILQPDLQLTTQELIQDLLPGAPRPLIRTAWTLFPGLLQTAERKPFLDKALSLLDQDPQALSAENLHLAGLAQWGLNKRDLAVQHLRAALDKEPHRTAWRLDLARLYFELRRHSEAREQLGIVLRESPGLPEAEVLRNALEQALWPENPPPGGSG